MYRRTPIWAPVLALGACVVALGTGVPALAGPVVGIVPPHNPAQDCSGGLGGEALSAINRCRSSEGIGPMTLPSNWARLSPVQQTFVAINLERVNRGLKPIAALTSSLDALAQKGAKLGEDPPFPAKKRGLIGGGSIWADTGSPLSAIFYWMYKDGPGGINARCTATESKYCWLHRDSVLSVHPKLVGGGGHTGSNTTFEILPAASGGSALVFKWSSELSFFSSAPGPEPK